MSLVETGMNDRAPIAVPTVENLIGTWRRFGPVGPVYEVIGAGDAQRDGDRMMRIRVLETREEVGYRLAHILDDPQER